MYSLSFLANVSQADFAHGYLAATLIQARSCQSSSSIIGKCPANSKEIRRRQNYTTKNMPLLAVQHIPTVPKRWGPHPDMLRGAEVGDHITATQKGHIQGPQLETVEPNGRSRIHWQVIVTYQGCFQQRSANWFIDFLRGGIQHATPISR